MQYNDRSWRLERDGRSVSIVMQHDITRDHLDVFVGGASVPLHRTMEPDGGRSWLFRAGGGYVSIEAVPAGNSFEYLLNENPSLPAAPPPAIPTGAPPATTSPPLIASGLPPHLPATPSPRKVLVSLASAAACLLAWSLSHGTIQRVIATALYREHWAPFTSTHGHFSIDMPGRPQKREETEHTKLGDLKVTTYAVDLPQRGYAAIFWDLPEAAQGVDPTRLLEGGRNGAAAQQGGTVSNSHPVSYHGSPGIEFDVITPKVSARERVYLVNNRVYHLFVAGESGVPEQEADRFFASFLVLND